MSSLGLIVAASVGYRIEQVVYAVAKVLMYPVLVATLVCLVWVLVELGYFCYEVYLRVRYRDLEALEIRTLKARDAFDRGQPRRAYRYLQQNNYSVVVARFLFELIRNYQTQRLPEKPLKLLQEYEFYTVKRLEKTRILVRVGPMLGLMGTLIPLAPALQALADGDTQKLADNLTVAFSITVLGLLIGGIAFMLSIFRDRFYSQDISDLEYLLELLEGQGGALRVGQPRRRKADIENVYDSDMAIDGEDADGGMPAAAEEAVTGVIAPPPAFSEAPAAPVVPPPASEPLARPAPFIPGVGAPVPEPTAGVVAPDPAAGVQPPSGSQPRPAFDIAPDAAPNAAPGPAPAGHESMMDPSVIAEAPAMQTPPPDQGAPPDGPS
jgi:biopolymer transport protein ExbB/TolQ